MRGGPRPRLSDLARGARASRRAPQRPLSGEQSVVSRTRAMPRRRCERSGLDRGVSECRRASGTQTRWWRDRVRRSPHEFAVLRMHGGCKTPKAAPIRSETPSQGGFPLVGVTGFEPATSSSRTTRATKLRHTPKAPRADEQSIRVARDQPFESEAVSVSTVTSGGQANRYVANGELPIPADTCNQEVCPSWAWVERPLARMVSRSQLVTRAP